ncbi:hypothetical protein [Crocosphaera sp. XPORK-15E]|uniref:hypothetical protein n=1 Tax=Crocosphaera sp. XPORK-15E TaxID=3110247 RepID=UPI002B20F10B|nr:hypothetical protein [Crocosphaera sp. XPORK-15E]MEA5533228.1 hypothetical protein [Crocosphaera sp. XPORK-15E]
MNTVQLLLRNGVNPEAFKVAFQNIMSENPEISYNSIQGFEKKGNDVLVTLEVPENPNKGKIEHQFNDVYEMKLEAVKQAALLEAEKTHKEEIKALTKDITEIAKLALMNKPNSTTIIDNKAMNNSSDSSQNITNSTLTNSIANLKEISGQVTNSINQLSDNSEDGSDSIKQLLSQLKTVIETEENLDNENKADALEEVKTIVDAANNIEDSNLKKLAKRSKNALMGIVATLPTATKLVQECNQLLPAIAKLLGL